MRRTSFRAVTVATATATLIAAGITAASAGTAAGTDAPDASRYAPGLVAAMERDLGLDTAEAIDRLRTDEALSATAHTLIKSLEATSLEKQYAGSWVEGDELYVAVTDKTAAAQVRAAGATAVTVDRSLAALDRIP